MDTSVTLVSVLIQLYSWCLIYTVPRVSIEEDVVDFGSMSVGQPATAVLHVRNDSDVTALFQVYT